MKDTTRTIAGHVRAGDVVYVPVGSTTYRVEVDLLRLANNDVCLIGRRTAIGPIDAVAPGRLLPSMICVPPSTPTLKETP